MAALKAETADAHAAVERRVDFERLTRSREEYVRTLEAFFGFYEPMEWALSALPRAGFEFVPEAKAPRLAADLAALGEADLARLPQCGDLPQVASTAARVGVLYVLEGASLGGQIISRRLKERLGVEPETGGSFFRGAGERTGARWREFGRAAEAAVASPDEISAAVESAKQTFAAFEAWLAGCGRRFDKEVR